MSRISREEAASSTGTAITSEGATEIHENLERELIEIVKNEKIPMDRMMTLMAPAIGLAVVRALGLIAVTIAMVSDGIDDLVNHHRSS